MPFQSCGKGNGKMIIEGFVWLADVLDKLEHKHAVAKTEVDDVFGNLPVF